MLLVSLSGGMPVKVPCVKRLVASDSKYAKNV